MVRELLDQETESAKKGPSSQVSRMNYDFVFLRRENFDDVLSAFWGSSRRGITKAFCAGRSGSMRALSVSGELKECQLRAPPFGSRTFISLCNLHN